MLCSRYNLQSERTFETPCTQLDEKTQHAIKKTSTLTVTLLSKIEIIKKRIVAVITVQGVPKVRSSNFMRYNF